ncbi:MAG: recombinase family protein [Anaerolineae bacterium]|nr:recombinase family protein [Anaerolineae bacterium]
MAKNGTVGLGYTRKSLVYERADETSVERQDSNLRGRIESDGLTPEIHTDAQGHRSGRSDRNRPAWRMIMRRIKDADVRALYVDSLSRAWRSSKGWNELLETCKRFNVALRILKEGIDTSKGFGAAQKLNSGVMAEVAEFESNIASERMIEISPF